MAIIWDKVLIFPEKFDDSTFFRDKSMILIMVNNTSLNTMMAVKINGIMVL